MPKQISSFEFTYYNDVCLKIYYTWYPPYKGARDSFMGRANAGAQLEPDEPAHVEIEKVLAYGENSMSVDVTGLFDSDEDQKWLEKEVEKSMEGEDE